MLDGTFLRAQAKRCLDLSHQCFDLTVAEQLRVLSQSFDAKAQDIDKASARHRLEVLRTEIARYVERLRQLAARSERWLHGRMRAG